MSNPIDQAKHDFEQVVDHLNKELQNLRSGRANASMVEDISVEAYGSMMELKGLASISIPDPKTIQIEPWDKNVTKDIEKALLGSNLGLNPNVSGSVIRLIMPAMTEENRKNMVKIVHQKAEQARIGIRNVREKVRDEIGADEEAKKISEDEKFRQLEQLDKVVVEWNAAIEKNAKDKEEEIMTI